MISTYIKLWLMVIAIFISAIALQGTFPIESAHAQSGMGGMGPGGGDEELGDED
jgi:hypothetical protein